jgi:hypothetical protein
MALTDEELIELAKKEQESGEEDLHDVRYFQEAHQMFDGTYPVLINHLYFYYKNWSSDPLFKNSFVELLKLNKKTNNYVMIDIGRCTIDFNKVIGDYVKKERIRQKEERSRKISSSKS